MWSLRRQNTIIRSQEVRRQILATEEGQKTDPRDRRHCVLGYVVALANERGGRLVLGMADARPHKVVGSDFAVNETGNLEDEIYKRLHIRVRTEELYDEKQRRVLVINVPSRPVGKALRFEGVPLMRVGESLREMDDAEYFSMPNTSPSFPSKTRISHPVYAKV